MLTETQNVTGYMLFHRAQTDCCFTVSLAHRVKRVQTLKIIIFENKYRIVIYNTCTVCGLRESIHGLIDCEKNE